MSVKAPPTDHARVRRGANRANYDRVFIDAVLDEALICHAGAVVRGRPMVIPTAHWRIGDTLYLHGHGKHGLLHAALNEGAICVEATLMDGLVMARSAFHHSVNYRSVIVHGAPREVTGEEKVAALDAFMRKITPDRVDGVRAANEQELKATLVIAVALDEASGKARTGMPIDDEEDYALPVWAGVVPISEVRGTPEQDTATRPPVA